MTRRNQKLKILVVEDDLIDRLQVSRAIQKAGIQCQFEEALTLEKARERLVMQEFDVIFLDNHLPDGYGAKFAREIRDTGLAKGARIVMLTGEPAIAQALIGEGCPWHGIMDKDDFSFRKLREVLLGENDQTITVSNADECMQLFRVLADKDLPGALDTLDHMSNEVWGRIDGAARAQG